MRYFIPMKLSQSRVLASVLLCLSTFGCREFAPVVETGPYRTEPIQENFSLIADPHARWAAYNLRSYVLSQTRICFCSSPGTVKVIVEDNRIIDVMRKSDGVSVYAEMGSVCKTVDDLFAFAVSVRRDSVADLRVEYDDRFGFPRFVYIDYSASVSGEELGFRTDSIERLIR